ncbi:MAG TPA: hypothetical protein PLQ54_10675 [Armatimonadota bacterium]|nr:hypothetical protein [Armatimonadota bacterium]
MQTRWRPLWMVAALVSVCGVCASQPDEAAEAAPTRLRRREPIRFNPPPDCEHRFACAVSGQLKASFWGRHRVRGEAVMLRKVLEVDPARDLVQVSTGLESGICRVDDTAKQVGGEPPLICDFDARHRLLRVSKSGDPAGTEEVASASILDLGSVMMFLFYSVPFHVRTAGVGTAWDAEYSCVDVNGDAVTLSGSHELIAFMFEGGRRVAVIRSDLQIPVYGKINRYRLSGTLQCKVISEVYVDCGGLRYRDSVGAGTLKASGGIISVDVDVSDLRNTLRLILPNGSPAEPLYDPTHPPADPTGGGQVPQS